MDLAERVGTFNSGHTHCARQGSLQDAKCVIKERLYSATSVECSCWVVVHTANTRATSFLSWA